MSTILAMAVGPDRDVAITPQTVDNGALKSVRPYVEGLLEALTNKGHKLGTEFVIDYREREVENLRSALAEAFQQSKIGLLFSMSTSVHETAMSLTDKLPIVFATSSYPVADRVVDSFAAPGRNATGVSTMRSQTADDCLEFFKATVPSLTEVYLLHKPRYLPALRPMRKLHAVAGLLGVSLTSRPVLSLKDIEAAVTGIIQRGPVGAPQRGVMALPDDLVLSATLKISEWALRANLPTFFPVPDGVRAQRPSPLAGFGISQRSCGEAAAEYVDKILWGGATPATLSLTRGGRFTFAVNRAVAEALKIVIPQDVLNEADLVI